MEAVKKAGAVTEDTKKKPKAIFTKKFYIDHGGNILCHIVLIGIIFLILFPFIQKISTMFLSYEDLSDTTVQYIPKHFSLYTVITTMGIMDYWRTLLRTLILCVITAVLQTLSCTLTAYGLARFKFVGRGLIFGCVIMILLIPPQVVMASLYMNFAHVNPLGLVSLFGGGRIDISNGILPFIILSATAVAFKNSLYIYMLRQFFRGLPTEIEEAGMIDGSSHLGIFFRLMLPNAVPMMVTIILFAFSWQWTDNYYSQLFLGHSDYTVITNALISLRAYGVNIASFTTVFRNAIIDTGIVLSILPLVIVYIFGQRFFVQGVSQSGIVG